MITSSYNRHENIFLRQVFLGILYDLADQLYLPPYKEGEENVIIPFFVNMAYTDERFSQDHFLIPDNCLEHFAEGNYDRIPRGIVTLNDVVVDESALTSPYSRGVYYEEINDEVRMLSSIVRNVPLDVVFDIEILLDTQDDVWIVIQKILDAFFKSRRFSFLWKGLRGSAYYGLSSTFNTERLFEFSYPEGNNPLSVTFTLETKCYYPIFDPRKTFEMSNVMSDLSNSISLDGIPPERIPNNPNYIPSIVIDLIR